MYATGRGVKADPVQAARWHLIARAGGGNDLFLEDFLRKMKPEDRAAGEAAAKPWIAQLAAQRGRATRAPAQSRSLDGRSAAGASHAEQSTAAGGHGEDQRQRHPARHGDRARRLALGRGEDQAVKPGKGPAYNQVELKNLLDGRKLNQRFGCTDRVEETEVERRQFQFLYRQDEQLVFMDTASYDQIELAEEFVGERAAFLQDGMMVQVQLHQDRPIGIKLPETVVLEVVEADASIKGQTAARPTSRPSWRTACASWCRRSSRPARRS